MAWKVVNAIVVLLPKFLLWKLTIETGTFFLMETSGIADIIVNSVALSFILGIDEMIFGKLLTWDERQLMERLVEFRPYIYQMPMPGLISRSLSTTVSTGRKRALSTSMMNISSDGGTFIACSPSSLF